MKKRVFLPMFLAVVMLAAMLAGCSSGSSAGQKEEPAAAVEQNAAKTEGTAMAASAAEEESAAAAVSTAETEAAATAASAAETEIAATAASAAEAESTAAAEIAATAASAAAEEITGLANPWSDVASAEEAAKGAGIDSFVIAEDPGIDLGENFERTYRCMDSIAEARLEYPASALTVRKGNGTYAEEGDISGDYTEYANTWTEDVNGIEVTCFGNREGDASKSIWTVDDMYFSIVAEGLGGDEDFGLNAERLAAMVSSIQ